MKLNEEDLEKYLEEENVTSSFDSEIGTTMAEMLLNAMSNVPQNVADRFKHWSALLTGIVSLSNIKRWERKEYIMAFLEVSKLIDMGMYKKADEQMALMLFELQLSRSIDATNMLYGMSNISKTTTTHLQPPAPEPQEKRGLMNRLRGKLKGGK